MDLTQEEVLKILSIIEKSNFDYMQLQVGELKLTVSKGGFIAGSPAAASAKEQPKPQPAPQAPPAVSKAAPAPAKPRVKASADGREIAAPMVGTFYAAPEPGAKPFVELGAEIDEETTVGLIEVMKVFNAVQSRVRGKIVEVLVQNGQFVEYGQPLFVVEPAKSKR
ncbi:MAG TPA: acetyl-CoA carboxylase biotin carboxyl carrier protein [Candidatus Binatia bacterium]|nr:acetyl-CoA carboxylase biotin carboxyl carrier protein [Candidatus Binatia bacterium]